MAGDAFRLTRRGFLLGMGAAGVAVVVPPAWHRSPAAAGDVDEEPVFLDRDQMETLRALVDRFIPGQPEDLDPGAVTARCAEAIDALLGAFEVEPPLIFAGAPFSDRGGHPTNHFEDFLPLDDHETLAWRLRIEGSGGRPALEFNGPVRGWQQTYLDGLRALDEAAPGDARFADLPGPARDLILRGSDDEHIDDLVDVAFPHTYEVMYGAPEYGGNAGLIGWDYTGWMGDVQPRGWTREEVENPDHDGTPEASPEAPIEELRRLVPFASHEFGFDLRARHGGSLRGIEDRMRSILDAMGEVERQLDSIGGRSGAADALGEGPTGGG